MIMNFDNDCIEEYDSLVAAIDMLKLSSQMRSKAVVSTK